MPSRMRWRFFSGRARTNIDLYVYVLAELVEHDHQTVNGEAVKLHVANAGKVRMTDTGAVLGLACPWRIAKTDSARASARDDPLVPMKPAEIRSEHHR